MSEVHRFSVVKMLSEAGNKISYDPHGPEIVMAKDYDALAAEAQALREEVAALRARGLTVSEGLLRRVCAEQPATCCMDDEMSWRRDRDSALIELHALLSEQEGGKQ
ncbi:hypothetical protein IPC1332_02760 [Pseudomonas aeruginosa]|uniref:hypothetical protein n=1 Tax=Pseudomonas aeruginosa TaxID=287 RepID=UPI0010681B23|nr:hypothetical protein [Pseudomonas aeruginosa]TEG91882.1 hypothetical protein IPC1332_02760 [Pseudomonas aeruginosa]